MDSLFIEIPKATKQNYRDIIHKTISEIRKVKEKKILEKNLYLLFHKSQQVPFVEASLLVQIELAKYYFEQKQETKSLELAFETYYKAKDLDADYEVAEVSAFLASLYVLNENNQKAMAYALEAQDIFEKLNMPKKASIMFYDIGLVQFRLKQWKKSLNTLLQIKEASLIELREQEHINYYNAIGLIYKKTNDYTKAIQYFHKAIDVAHKFKRNEWIAILTGNIGDVYASQKLFDSARRYWQMDLDTCIKYKVWGNVVATSNYWADSYKQENKPIEALKYYQKSLQYLDSLPTKEYDNRLTTYRGCSHIYFQLKDFEKAFFYEKQANIYYDSLQNFLKASEVLQTQTSFEVSIKEKELLSKKLDAEKRDTFIWIGISILILLISVLGWLLRRQYILNNIVLKQKTDIAEQNEEISRQNEELWEQQQEILSQTEVIYERNQEQEILIQKLHENEAFLREALNEVIRSEKIINEKNETLQSYNKNLEDEVVLRTQELSQKNQELMQTNSQLEQFAYVLAHNLRSPIARLRGLVSCIDMNNPNSSDNFKILEYIGTSSLELDSIVKDLNKILEIKKNVKEVYELVNLYERISENLENIKSDYPNIDFDLDLALQINEVYSVKAYINSIFYNLISNAFKYRIASKRLVITIKTAETNDFIYIEFSDNGLGIDLEKFKDKIFTPYKRFHEGVEGKGLGLHLVKIQVEALKGSLDIKSTVNQGTTFQIYLKK
ncbi:MAG: tetratricopeptide repeat protein [Raineya sp.]|nr:tetratricopeptide repeat protein [Raineya sp.]